MTKFPPMPLLPITSPSTVERCRSLALRPSDVFVCSYPKSGTTWTQHVVLSLLLADRRHRARRPSSRPRDGLGDGGGDRDRRQKPRDHREEVFEYDHVSDLAPFFEIDAHWDPDGDGLAAGVRGNHDRLGRRVFNTHLRWEMLPKRREGGEGSGRKWPADSDVADGAARPACGKFIYVTRNLPDVCASFYHHLSNQGEGTYAGSLQSFAGDWMAGKIPFGSPLHHLLSFAEGFSDNRYASATDTLESCGHQEERPLLLLSYERMKSNLREEVLRIVNFLGLDSIPTEVLDREILPTFSFRSMKANSHRFQPKSVTWLNGYQFLRKGESGDGRKTFVMDDDGRGLGVPLMAAFRDWVNREDYCGQVRGLMYSGLDRETAETLHAVVW